MWTFDMGTCANCAEVKTCPDCKEIQKTLRKLLDTVETNEGGSAAGIIVVACKDQK